MGEINRIVRLLDDLQKGECWIGVNMEDVLSNLGAAQALSKIDGRSNCIWQLLNHVRYWRLRVVNRLRGSDEPPGFPDMLLPSHQGQAEWEKTIADFNASYETLRMAILSVKEENLEKPSPKADQTYYQLLHGVVEHDCYHMGQMLMIKKYAQPA